MDRLKLIRQKLLWAMAVPYLPALDDALNLIDAELRAREEERAELLFFRQTAGEWQCNPPPAARASAGEVT